MATWPVLSGCAWATIVSYSLLRTTSCASSASDIGVKPTDEPRKNGERPVCHRFPLRICDRNIPNVQSDFIRHEYIAQRHVRSTADCPIGQSKYEINGSYAV